MSAKQVDAYLATVPEPQRSTLKALRKTILALLPDAEECISYGFPCYKADGKGIVGFASFKNHCSYLPMSGAVLETMADALTRYEYSQGALRFPIDKPLPATLVKKLIKARLRDIAERAQKKSR
ncbi:MAG: DUF1801 domain-containing protein [Deltaproteobacteria bacterium]|nr:DUF1801 domain-containing protein [Deltaproteobacteria bacterium]